MVGEAQSASAGLADFISHEQRFYKLSCHYLGGKKFWSGRLASRSDVHSAIVNGVPYGSLVFLVSQVKELEEDDLAKVLGISTRTLRRQSETPDKPMPADLASKTAAANATRPILPVAGGGSGVAAGQRPDRVQAAGEGDRLRRHFAAALAVSRSRGARTGRALP